MGLSLEEGERILSGVDSGAVSLEEGARLLIGDSPGVTEEEALAILEGRGVTEQEQEKKKGSGPSKAFRMMEERIAEIDRRIEALKG